MDTSHLRAQRPQRRTRNSLVAAILLGFVSMAALAADFPASPVKLIHGLPGGLVDVGTRVLADELSTRWKTPVIVEGKPGAGETLAADSVARGPKDGNSLLIVTDSVLVNHGLLFRKPVVDAQKDLVPVCDLFEVPFALVVRADLGVNTAAEFVEMMRRDGTKRIYASSGPGSPLHLTMEAFARSAGFQMTHVPYKTLAQLTQDLVGGSIDAAFFGVTSAMPFVKSGKLKLLGVTGAARSNAAPQVPTFAELGYRDMNQSTVITLAAPTGTPPAVLARIEADVKQVIHSPAYATRFLQPQELKPATACMRELPEAMAARRAATQRIVQSLDLKLD